MEDLGDDTKMKLGLIVPIFWAIVGVVAAISIWVGTIQARVEGHERVQTMEAQKLDDVAKTVNTVNGKMDVILEKLR